jgi:hypothetical protein
VATPLQLQDRQLCGWPPGRVLDALLLSTLLFVAVELRWTRGTV